MRNKRMSPSGVNLSHESRLLQGKKRLDQNKDIYNPIEVKN